MRPVFHSIRLVLFIGFLTLFYAVPSSADPASATVPSLAHQRTAVETEGLLCLQDLIPDMIPDVRYATTNNFTHKQVYDSDRLFLRDQAARNLASAAAYLNVRHGLRFKIFDGYRPLSVQKKFWAILPDPAYVADPKTGSRHNRGAAVDLTLVDRDGKDLDMGTEFDDFTPRAGWAARDISATAKKNRLILKGVMEKFGFKALPSEWWHYDYSGLATAPIMDIPIDN